MQPGNPFKEAARALESMMKGYVDPSRHFPDSEIRHEPDQWGNHKFHLTGGRLDGWTVSDIEQHAAGGGCMGNGSSYIRIWADSPEGEVYCATTATHNENILIEKLFKNIEKDKENREAKARALAKLDDEDKKALGLVK